MKAKVIVFMLFVVAFFASPMSSLAQQSVIKSKFYEQGKSAIVTPNGQSFVADMQNFRPIDFLVGGYGTFMMETMDNIAGKNGFNLSEARTEIRLLKQLEENGTVRLGRNKITILQNQNSQK